jgi:hypothetical protein
VSDERIRELEGFMRGLSGKRKNPPTEGLALAEARKLLVHQDLADVLRATRLRDRAKLEAEVRHRARMRNPGTDDRARRAARAGDPIAVVRERLRAGQITPEQVAWAEALTWKPRPGRASRRTRPGDFVRRGLVPFEEGLTELVGSGAIRWHLQGGDEAYAYLEHTPAFRLEPGGALALFDSDGSAYGDWQVMRVDDPDDEASLRFQREAAARYAAAIGITWRPGHGTAPPADDYIHGDPPDEFTDLAAGWYVAAHLLPRKDRAAVATVAFLAVHNPINAWEVFRGWRRRYLLPATGGLSETYPHPATQHVELDEDLRGLVLHLLGGPT